MASPIRCGILVISDRCHRKETIDESGPRLMELLRTAKSISASVEINDCVPDEQDAIQAILTNWVDVLGIELIITTGGTGFGVRDVTPEATIGILGRQAYGLMSAIAQQTYPHSILSRGVAGTRKSSLIINFPGSPKACRECFAIVESKIPHIIDLLRNNVAAVRQSHHEKPPVSATTVPAANTTPSHGVAFRNRKSPYPVVPVPEAQSLVWQQVELLETEAISFRASLGRILAKDVVAKEPLPPFRASIKDGYAVLSGDGAGVRSVAGLSLAGSQTGKGLVPGSCYRITTGAPVPDEADAVVQVEDTELVEHDKDGEEVTIKILKAPSPNQDIRAVGSDIAAGSVTVPAGARIDPACLGVLATCGATTIQVHKKPLIALLSTGDELVAPEISPLPYGKIRDSNKTVLQHTIEKAGFHILDFGIAHDTLDLLVASIRGALEKADVLVLTGGVSMGEKDLVKMIVVDILKGVIHFGRVLMKPGLPTTFATVEIGGKKKLIFGLPGNPVSAAVTCNLFVLPALRTMAGYRDFLYTIVRAELEKDIRLDPRPEFHRAFLVWSSGKNWPVVHSTGNQISSRLLSMSGADVLLCLPGKTEAVSVMPAGSMVETILL